MQDNNITSLNTKLQNLISRFPRSFDTSIFKERDRVLAFFDNDFIKKRSASQLLQLITSFYIKKKELLRTVASSPTCHHIKIRFIPTKIQYPFMSKWVIGILVQISLQNHYELFNQKHLLKAVQHTLPELKIIKGSTYVFQDPDETIKTLYIECEKPYNQKIVLHELNSLKKSLKEEIFSRIERVVPSVFMTRNQEEALRNILTLSREIENPEEMPQVMISFEMQTTENFVFNILCVCSKNSLINPIELLTTQKHPFFSWRLERKQLVKYVGQYEPVFAYILQLFLSPNPSVSRNDGSLNFLEARHQIVQLLKNHIGEFRDFNGGILIKQQEALLAIHQAFPEIDAEILENIFHAITPIEMQAILPLPTLRVLIQTIIKFSNKTIPSTAYYILDHEKYKEFNFIIICLTNGDFYEMIKEHLISFDLPEIVLASLSIPNKKFHILSYIIKTDDPTRSKLFLQTLTQLLILWSEKMEKQQVLSLFLEKPIISLDPRIGEDFTSSILLKLLFEGLMRINAQGTLEMAIAQNIQISPDKKTYTFYLRPSVWSDGTPLTSYDFEYAWKKILSPNFTTPAPFFFDIIKNAMAAKNGHVPMNEIGIFPLNNYTLQIKLEYQTPYFLEYLTLPLFFPICREIDINKPNWPYEEKNNYVCNGAFTLEKNNKTNFVFTKNQTYYDKDKIHLDKIIISSSHHSQIYDFFVKNKVHWLGGPMGAWNDNFKPTKTDELITYSDYGIYWCSCNTKHPLLKNRKIREALHLAIDREKFLQTTQYFQKPAYSPLPLPHSQYIPTKDCYNPQKGKTLLQKGLKELETPLETIKDLSVFYSNDCTYGKSIATFLHEQWKNHLGINITPKPLDYKTLFSNLNSADFHLILSRWQPWVSDPMYTLGCFFYLKDPRNHPQWSHLQFQQLIKQALKENEEVERKKNLMKAELILIKELPIIPLFHTHYQAIKKKSLLFQPNHMLLDFKWAKFI
jgi:oligopeptide transport system substrate-binding protein